MKQLSLLPDFPASLIFSSSSNAAAVSPFGRTAANTEKASEQKTQMLYAPFLMLLLQTEHGTFAVLQIHFTIPVCLFEDLLSSQAFQRFDVRGIKHFADTVAS